MRFSLVIHRSRFLAIGLAFALSSGCAVNAVRDGYRAPVEGRSQPGAAPLNVTSLFITSRGADLDNSDRQALRRSFSQCMANTGLFSKVEMEGSSTENTMKAELAIDLDRSFKWWAAWPAIYPMVAYWPVQPYTADGLVTLKAEGEIGGQPLSFSAKRNFSHTQIMYGFFIRSPVEIGLSNAYDQLFMELRDKLQNLGGGSGYTAPAVATKSTPTTVRKIKNIAVWDLDANGVDSTLTRVVADQITSNLLQRGRFTVLERRKMSEVLAEQGFQNSGACDNQGCLVEVGKLLGVDAIVAGTVSKIMNLYIANVRLIDVQSGRIIISTQASTEQGIQHLLSTDLKTITDQF